jgi:TAG lipase/lysophosphatidylethanolamine acyltransferase
LLRNLGNICDPRLFTRSFTGTKTAIEDYISEVLNTIQAIYEAGNEHPQQKFDLFQDVEQSFGHTALLMQGGGSFGLFHLGVAKALVEADLLPRVISGSSVGALMAALICTKTDDELPKLFTIGGIDLKAFSTLRPGGSIQRKIIRLFTEGYLLDVTVLEECIKANLKDMTFEVEKISLNFLLFSKFSHLRPLTCMTCRKPMQRQTEHSTL